MENSRCATKCLRKLRGLPAFALGFAREQKHPGALRHLPQIAGDLRFEFHTAQHLRSRLHRIRSSQDHPFPADGFAALDGRWAR
jgi:hypothetical protein